MAWADCEPASPSSGDTVICTGNPNGFSTDGLGSLTVNVLTGTNLNGPFTASNTGTLDISSAGNLQTMTLTDNGTVVFVNSGNINSGVVIVGDGDHDVTNLEWPQLDVVDEIFAHPAPAHPAGHSVDIVGAKPRRRLPRNNINHFKGR